MGLVEAALVLSAVGTVGSMIQGRKAAKQQKAAIAAQNRQQKLEQAMQRRKAAREARAATAAAINAGEIQGAGESTVVAGTTAALQSQLSGNLSFLNQSEALIDQANRARMAAVGYESKAAAFSGLSSLGMSVFSYAGQLADLRKGTAGPFTTGGTGGTLGTNWSLGTLPRYTL